MIKELTIGSTVLYKGNKVRVTKIEENLINGIPSSEFSGVPITEDLVKELGYVREYDKLFPEEYIKIYRKRINGFIFDVSFFMSNTMGRDWSLHIDTPDCRTAGCLDIKYLHQLEATINLIIK